MLWISTRYHFLSSGQNNCTNTKHAAGDTSHHMTENVKGFTARCFSAAVQLMVLRTACMTCHGCAAFKKLCAENLHSSKSRHEIDARSRMQLCVARAHLCLPALELRPYVMRTDDLPRWVQRLVGPVLHAASTHNSARCARAIAHSKKGIVASHACESNRLGPRVLMVAGKLMRPRERTANPPTLYTHMYRRGTTANAMHVSPAFWGAWVGVASARQVSDL